MVKEERIMALETHYQGQRLHYRVLAREAYEKITDIAKIVANTELDEKLIELINVRASQINGCAFCLDIHIKDALAIGESSERLNLLVIWRETSLFTEKEQAALSWTEAITNIQTNHPSNELFELMKKNFTDEEIVTLTMQILYINSQNRLGITFRPESGKYLSKKQKKTETT